MLLKIIPRTICGKKCRLQIGQDCCFELIASVDLKEFHPHHGSVNKVIPQDIFNAIKIVRTVLSLHQAGRWIEDLNFNQEFSTSRQSDISKTPLILTDTETNMQE